MRPLALPLLAFAALSALSAEQPYPLWDGQESIERYAKRANLPPTKTLDLGNGVKLELVLVPAGEFMMGDERIDDAKPAQRVKITKPFYLGKFEVTQVQYQQVMAVNPSEFKGRDLPVEQVSWDDAQEFCKKAGGKTGLAVRLPTEAEWEHACRAGTKTIYCTGDADADLDRAAWYGKNSGNMTHPVGRKTANVWGLYDMHGNVWEWCQDFYEPYQAEAAVDPQGPAQGVVRVMRGGSWGDDPGICRSADRSWCGPVRRDLYLGFRVAADVPSKTP